MSSTILDYVMEPSATSSSTTTGGVTVVNHPLVQVHVTKLRNKTTHPSLFRIVEQLAALMAYEATKDLHLADTRVQTALEETDGVELAERVGLIPRFCEPVWAWSTPCSISYRPPRCGTLVCIVTKRRLSPCGITTSADGIAGGRGDHS